MKARRLEYNLNNISITCHEENVPDGWDDLVDRLQYTNLAHASSWLHVIKKTYNHSPLYYKAEDNQGHIAILPAFFVHSRLFGNVICSMPFLDSGGPCGTSVNLLNTLINYVSREAAEIGAQLIELRCTTKMDYPMPVMLNKVNLILPLANDPNFLWQQLNAKVRNQVRKAQRSGLSVEFGGAEMLDDFYGIFAANMRNLGSPVHSRVFFSSVLDEFGADARVALVRRGAESIGGLIALSFKNTFVVPWASSLRSYFHLSPNMLLYWETIYSACIGGFQRFDFGRSSRDSGTYKFKRQWGALEEQLYWYSIPVGYSYRTRLSVTESQRELIMKLWRYLPLGFTRWLGPYIRRGLTQ